MKSISHEFEQLKHDMSAAFDAGQWQRLAELDRYCQQLVRDRIKINPKIMFEELRTMLGFYESLRNACRNEKDEFAGKVQRIKSDRQNSRTYDQFQRLSV